MEVLEVLYFNAPNYNDPYFCRLVILAALLRIHGPFSLKRGVA